MLFSQLFRCVFAHVGVWYCCSSNDKWIRVLMERFAICAVCGATSVVDCSSSLHRDVILRPTYAAEFLQIAQVWHCRIFHSSLPLSLELTSVASIPGEGGGIAPLSPPPPIKNTGPRVLLISVFACRACFILLSDSVVILTEFLHVFLCLCDVIDRNLLMWMKYRHEQLLVCYIKQLLV